MFLKQNIVIFLTAFILNAVWENLHSFLYVHYKGGEITQFILMRATLADAMMILVLLWPFLLIPFFKKYDWLIIVLGVMMAVAIEQYALTTGRWAYGSLMPIIPLLGTGLTPTIQLGLLGYLTFRIQKKVFKIT